MKMYSLLTDLRKTAYRHLAQVNVIELLLNIASTLTLFSHCLQIRFLPASASYANATGWLQVIVHGSRTDSRVPLFEQEHSYLVQASQPLLGKVKAWHYGCDLSLLSRPCHACLTCVQVAAWTGPVPVAADRASASPACSPMPVLILRPGPAHAPAFEAVAQLKHRNGKRLLAMQPPCDLAPEVLGREGMQGQNRHNRPSAHVPATAAGMQAIRYLARALTCT